MLLRRWKRVFERRRRQVTGRVGDAGDRVSGDRSALYAVSASVTADACAGSLHPMSPTVTLNRKLSWSENVTEREREIDMDCKGMGFRRYGTLLS